VDDAVIRILFPAFKTNLVEFDTPFFAGIDDSGKIGNNFVLLELVIHNCTFAADVPLFAM
jgi:hypothetical protein